MSINFFDTNCQSQTNQPKFGICDDSNEKPAYIDIDDDSKWIAIVENSQELEVIFTAIDHCIKIFRSDGKIHSFVIGSKKY